MSTRVVPAEELWFRRFLPLAAPRVRLFCFAHAGGAASAFRGWPTRLPDDVELLAVRYPGRQDRLGEPGAHRMVDLVEPVTAAMEPMRRAPFALFGHSMGAAVAYEVAVRLERLGTPPLALFVSSREAPRHHAPSGLVERDDTALLDEVRALGSPHLTEVDSSLLELMLPALRADWTVLETYRPTLGRVLSCPIIAYTALDDPAAPLDRVVDWAESTTAMFARRTFEGGHFYLIDQEEELLGDLGRHLASVGRSARHGQRST